MKTLRLVLFEECNRRCEGCCNKDWDLGNLEVCRSYKEYNEIVLTGGEPMLMPEFVKHVVKKIRQENSEAKIYMYTAKVDTKEIYDVLKIIDGITVTLHEQEDVEPFLSLDTELYYRHHATKSLRVNVFSNVKFDKNFIFMPWKIKDKIEWIKDCPLPENEVLMRYEK